MVKPGYKQTEVGVIPDHWRISSLATAFQRLEAGVSVNSDDSLSSEYHILKTSAVHNGIVDTAETKPVIPRDYPRLKCPLEKGSIVISRMNTPALVGECGFAKDTKAGTYLPDRLWQIQNLNTDSFDFVWLNYLLNSKQYRDAVRATATGTSNSMKNISKERLLDIKIPHPPISEQADIAVALLEVDELINLIEKQISKKKAIKQGAMQELLTGKKRLPGFFGVWQYMELGKHGTLIRESINPQLFPSGYFWEYSMPAFDNEKTPVKQIGSDMHSNRTVIYGKVLLFNKLNVRQKRIWMINQCRNRAVCSSEFLPYQSDKINLELLAQVLNTDEVTLEFVGMSTGTSNSQKRIAPNDFLEYKVYLPIDEDEQTAIAEILVCMDKEIEALNHKLAKYRQVKQGMMQQLLTGKIRLKNDVVDSVHTEQKASAKISSVRSAHNHQFDDAVAIAAIVDVFYSDKYPLGRVKVQKLLYLLHRHQAVSVADFKKKAAGPYADNVRYRGGEPIAKKNKYIVSESSKQGTRYYKGENMAQALNYVERWGMQEDLQWLKENFLHTSRNDLELYATVDMAICDLNEAGVPISVASIKNLIASTKEWKAKLSKTYFSDRDIARAIKKCAELFN